MIEYRDTLEGILPAMLEGFFVGWPNPPDAATHFRLLQNSAAVLLAVDPQAGRVVGFITAISDGVLSAYIPHLEVLPEYQGQGIGSALVKEMFTRLEEYYMIDLVCDENVRAFYERLGMIPVRGMVRRNHARQNGRS